MDKFIDSLKTGNNYPPEGSITFTSSDHIRFQDGQDVSGHNYGANRRLVIEKDIEGGEGTLSQCIIWMVYTHFGRTMFKWLLKECVLLKLTITLFNFEDMVSIAWVDHSLIMEPFFNLMATKFPEYN